MENKEVQEVMKPLFVIWTALCLGQMLIAGVFYYLIATGKEDPVSTSLVLLLILGLGGFAAILTGVFIYRVRLKSIVRKDNVNILDVNAVPENANYLTECLLHYRANNIVRYAFMEGGNILFLLGAFLTHQITFFILFFVGLLLFAAMSPSVRKFGNDYHIAFSPLD